MGNISKIISGTGVLIALYLIIMHPNNVTKIINSTSSLYTSSVKTLQGR